MINSTPTRPKPIATHLRQVRRSPRKVAAMRAAQIGAVNSMAMTWANGIMVMPISQVNWPT
ncbi:hypothetical protein D3C80_1778870 [compost metagenome]